MNILASMIKNPIIKRI